MQILHYLTGILNVNTYILVNETSREAIAIDTGGSYEFLKAEEKNKKFNIKYIILTHGHFDHTGACKNFQKDKVQVGISQKDFDMCGNEKNLAASFGAEVNYFVPDFTFKEGDILNYCNIKLNVIETPGHTAGSVCFIVDDVIFSGDTLFYESVGRTDFPTGSSRDLASSIKNKLFSLDRDYRVLSGHGEETSLNYERKFNPYV